MVGGERVYRKSEYRFLEHIKELMTAENRTPDKSPGVVIRDLNVINWAWNKYAEENELLTTKEETRKHQYFLGKQKKAEDVDDIKRIKKEWIIRLQRAEAGLHTLRSRSSSASSFAVPEDNNFINDFIEEDSGEESGMPENREEGQNWANMEDRSDGGELAQDYVWRNRDDESLIDAREKVLFANNKSSIEDNGLSVLDDLEDDDYDDEEDDEEQKERSRWYRNKFMSGHVAIESEEVAEEGNHWIWLAGQHN